MKDKQANTCYCMNRVTIIQCEQHKQTDTNLQKWRRNRLMQMLYDRWGKARQHIEEESVREEKEKQRSSLRLCRRHNRLAESRTVFWGSASGQSQDRNTKHHGQKSALPKDHSNLDFYPDLLIGSEKGNHFTVNAWMKPIMLHQILLPCHPLQCTRFLTVLDVLDFYCYLMLIF